MGKFLLVIIVFAALVYAVFWLIERRRARPSGPTSRPAARPATRMSTPDDDEDFLRDLDRRFRRPDQDKPNSE